MEAGYNAPKIGTRMLNLPKNWRKLFAGGATRCLFRQLNGPKSQIAFQRHLIDAALEIHAEAQLKRTGRALNIRRRTHLRWQINDYTVMLCPNISDNAIYLCQQLSERMPWYTIIVPPDTSGVFGYALKELMRDKAPTVFTIDAYITWRTVFDSYEFATDSRETFIEILCRYNKRASLRSGSQNLIVRVPSDSEKSST